MKKIITLLILGCYSLSMSAYNYDFEEGGLYYLIKKVYNGYYAFVTYKEGYKYSGNIVIPSTVSYDGETYRVIGIGKKCFSCCSDLSSVTIPEGVELIDDYAFEKCQMLSSLTIPQSLKEISDYAFQYCTNMTSLNIPPNCEVEFSTGAFYACERLADLKICKSYGHVIRNYCFYHCRALTTINIPDDVVSIGNSVFNTCGLTSIVIPNSVEEMGSNIFCNCKQLVSVKNSDNLKSISKKSFKGCTSLKSIIIPKKVKLIEEEAFNGCSSLTTFYSLNPIPPDTKSETFDYSTIKKATLYVPIGSKEAYSNAYGWKEFYTIVEIDASSVENVNVNNDNENTPTYNLQGVRISSKADNLQKGIYIKNKKKVIIK